MPARRRANPNLPQTAIFRVLMQGGGWGAGNARCPVRGPAARPKTRGTEDGCDERPTSGLRKVVAQSPGRQLVLRAALVPASCPGRLPRPVNREGKMVKYFPLPPLSSLIL